MAASGKYKKEYCDKLIAHMEEGLSLESFAGVARVSVRTIHDWVQRYDDFAKAKSIGEGLSLLWWEKLGRAGAAGKIKGFGAAPWIFTMKVRYHKFGWRDVQEIEVNRFEDKQEQAVRLLESLKVMMQDTQCSQTISLESSSPPQLASGLLTESSKPE